MAAGAVVVDDEMTSARIAEGETRGASDVALVFGGKTGWIGKKMVELFEARGRTVYAAESRLENRDDVAKELDRVKPTVVINCAGLTGRPNVDWCEDHKEEVVRVNVVGTLSLLDLCSARSIHVTNLATGCIFEYDDTHRMGSGIGFKEEDKPNFTGSFYSETKAVVEQLSRVYSNVLTLRLRMPISDDLNPRSFVTKIAKYAKVVDIPNSMSVLHDLLPAVVALTDRRVTGILNFTNPGVISHNQVLSLYKEILDPSFWWENFTLEEQAEILKAPRSNNELDATKLLASVPDLDIPPIQEAVRRCFLRMKESMIADGTFPPPNPKGPKPEK